MTRQQETKLILNILTVIGIILCLSFVASAFRDLNDGRVLTVVKQITSIQQAQAQALAPKRTK